MPSELQRIVTKCLRKERDERYQTMKDLLLDLKELRDELALEAKMERSVSSERISATANKTLIAEKEITTGQSAQHTNSAGPKPFRARNTSSGKSNSTDSASSLRC